MFASKLTEPQTKATPDATSSLAHPHTGLITKRRDLIQHGLWIQRAFGNQATLRLLNQQVAGPAGEPLDSGTRAFMERRFGQDFGEVRVHAGEQAAEAARAMNAIAYTSGHDVLFSKGTYSPSTRDGRKLLAHELAHVLQQGKVSRASQEIEEHDSPAEREAERSGAQVGSGIPVGRAPLRRENRAHAGERGDRAARFIFGDRLGSHER